MLDSNNTTNYGIISLLMRPIPAIKTERKVSGYPASLVVGTLKAAKINGQSNISLEALGAREILARKKDGSLILDKNGQTKYVTHPEIVKGGKAMWFNHVAALSEAVYQFNQTHVEQVASLDKQAAIAAKPLIDFDKQSEREYIAARAAAAKKAAEDEAYAELVVAEQKKAAEKLAALEKENADLKAKMTAADTGTDTPDDGVAVKKGGRKTAAVA